MMNGPLLHPITRQPLLPVGYRRDGRPILPILGGDESTDAAAAAAAAAQAAADAAAASKTGADTFPANTPVADMTTEQQIAYWKHHSRKHEELAKAYGGLTPEQAREQQAELDRLRQASLTDNERAIEAAKAEGKSEAMKGLAPQLVAAELRAQTTGRLTDDQRTALLEGIDHTAFLTGDGVVDTAKVTAWIDRIAPTGGTGSGFPNLGQGRRQGADISGAEQGRAEAERRFGSKTRT
ncbi:MAG: hypothetical protein JWM93_102 [Frankiales bacterium]|nr:hypothetical protein [Frankiales bacterium]